VARGIVTPSADADTAEIIAYLEVKAGFAAAARYIASFERLYDILADFPGAGLPRPALGAHIRIGVVLPS
jgi:toxin ParE1/3/4